MGALLVLTVIGWLVVRSSGFQTWATNQFAERIERQYGGYLEVGELSVRFPKSLHAKNVLLKDQLGDTLCFIPEVQAGIKSLNFGENIYELRRVKFLDPYIQLLEDPGGGYNFDFFIEMVTPKDSIPPPVFVKSPIINAHNATIVFRKFATLREDGMLNPDNLEINGLDISLMRFDLSRDSIDFRIRNMSFSEISGFSLKDLDGEFHMERRQIELDALKLVSPDSKLDIPILQADFSDFDPEKDLVENLKLKLKVNAPSLIHPADIKYFYRNDSISFDKINLAGDIEMNPGEWDFSKSRLHIGDWFGFEGNINIKSPKRLNTFYNSAVDTLWFDYDRMTASYPSIFIDFDTLNLPFNADMIGSVLFNGSVEGRPDDFEARGELKIGAGAFNGNLSIHPGINPDILDVDASYRASLLHLDNFLSLETGFGLVSADGKLQGTWDGDSIYKLQLETKLPFVQWQNYYYTNVDLNAIIQHKLYEASLVLDDDNGTMDLFGRVNLRPDDPVFDLDIALEDANLFNLNLYHTDTIAMVDLNLHASFSGKEVDDVLGQLWVENSSFRNSRGEIPIKELELEVVKDIKGKKIELRSDYVDGRMQGDIFLDDLFGQLSSIGGRFLPLNINTKVVHQDRLNDFSFNINFKDPRLPAQVLTSNFIFKSNSQLSGFIKNGGRELDIQGNSPQFIIGRKQFTALSFSVKSIDNDLELSANLDKVELDQNNVFNNIIFNATMLPDLMETNLSWQGKDSTRYLSEINPSLSFERGKGTFPRLIVDVPNSTIFYKEKEWEIGDSQFQIDKKFFSVSNMAISSLDEHMLMNGVISDYPGDTLELDFQALDLGIVNQISASNNFDLGGLIDGETKVFDFYNGGLFLADLKINDFSINGEKVGTTAVVSQRDENGDDILINILTKRGDLSTLQMDGKYTPSNDKLDLLFKLDKLRLNMFDPFLSHVLSDIGGIATGDISIKGTRKDPIMDGIINVQKGTIKVDYLNAKFNFTHPIVVTRNSFTVDSLIARDSLGNQAIVDGGVFHNNFRDISLDFNINADNMLFINTQETHGNGYWGKIFATGQARIKGPVEDISIDVSARTTGNSSFSIPISDEGSAREFDFISYIVHEVPDEDPDLLSFNDSNSGGRKAKKSDLDVSLNIDVTPQAEVFLIFDATVGDVLSGRGRGNLQIDVNTNDLFNLNGVFNFDEGKYLFTLQNMPLKQFAIETGSSISWTGKVEEAQLDIDAVYTARAALYDLLQEESEGLTERVPVTCHLLMDGILESPDLSFSINLPPSSDDMARSQLEGLTDDEIKKQLFSLLILNRFQPLPGLNSSASSRSYGNAGLATTTSVLSSQLNYWLSQISNDFDIGFDYRPGDQITSDEVEVALSTQIFNNRMSINLNGNMDMKSSQGETNQLVGDVEVDYKIKPSGKIRVKAYNRSNDRLIYEYSPYTQGVGLFYREEFDTFGELMKRYWKGVFGQGKKGNLH